MKNESGIRKGQVVRTPRRRQILTVAPVLTALLATMNIPGLANAQNQEQVAAAPSAEASIAPGRAVVFVISMAGAWASERVAKANFSQIEGREGMRSQDQIISIHQPPEVRSPEAAAQKLLRQTAPGDVIRIQYNYGGLTNASHAVGALREAEAIWVSRVAETEKEYVRLETELKALKEVNQTRARFVDTPNARAQKLQLIERIKKLEKQQLFAAMVDQDAQMRLQMTRTSLQVVKSAFADQDRGIPNKFYDPIVYDVLVGPKARTQLTRFLSQPVLDENRQPSYVRLAIARVQMPSMALRQRAMKGFAGGVAGLLISGGLIFEELIVGAIGDSLEDLARRKYSPTLRIEPSGVVD